MIAVPWDTFTTELAGTFSALSSDDVVIIHFQGIPVIQFTLNISQSGSYAALRAEAFSDDYYPEDRKLSADEIEQLRSLGWNAPDPPFDENWWTELSWPFSGESCRRLAQLIVTSLREVYKADDLAGFSYRAFNAMGHNDIVVPALAQFPRLPRKG